MTMRVMMTFIAYFFPFFAPNWLGQIGIER